MAVRHYALRRLNPIQGVLQVLELEGGRALSTDGRHWEIQVLAPRPEHSWRSANQHDPVLQFFRFGDWHPQTGLSRVPISPILDLDTMLSNSEEILSALPTALERLPFPLIDRQELWLLDTEARPLALIAAAFDESARNPHPPRPWTAEGPAAQALEPCLQRRGGSTPQYAWMPRDAAPLLPLCQDWERQEDRQLVQNYLDWCAPWLLCLQDLDDATRAELERAAAKRATELARQFRLYPKVLDRGLLNAARVEARLRGVE